MKCSNCGQESKQYQGFCPNCGHEEPIKQESEPKAEAKATSGETAKDDTANKQATEVQSQERREEMDLRNGRNNAVASLVCGILAFFIPFVGIVLSIVAIVLGSMGKKRLPENERGIASAGFILGIVSLVFSIIVIVAFAAFLGIATFALAEAGQMFSSSFY